MTRDPLPATLNEQRYYARPNIEVGFDLQGGNDIWPVVSYLKTSPRYLGCCTSLAILTGYFSRAAHSPPLNIRFNVLA